MTLPFYSRAIVGTAFPLDAVLGDNAEDIVLNSPQVIRRAGIVDPGTMTSRATLNPAVPCQTAAQPFYFLAA